MCTWKIKFIWKLKITDKKVLKRFCNSCCCFFVYLLTNIQVSFFVSLALKLRHKIWICDVMLFSIFFRLSNFIHKEEDIPLLLLFRLFRHFFYFFFSVFTNFLSPLLFKMHNVYRWRPHRVYPPFWSRFETFYTIPNTFHQCSNFLSPSISEIRV